MHELVVDAQRHVIDDDIADGSFVALEAFAQGLEVGQPPGFQVRIERLSQFGLAAALMSQRQQADSRDAGVAVVARREQRLEGP